MTTTLMCGGKPFEVTRRKLILLKLFEEHTDLMMQPYYVRSTEDTGVFEDFVRCVKGERIEINGLNFSTLGRLCDEFGFERLSAEVQEYERCHPEQSFSVVLRRFEKHVSEHGRRVEGLCARVRSLEKNEEEIASLGSEVEVLISSQNSVSRGLSAAISRLGERELEDEELRRRNTVLERSLEKMGKEFRIAVARLESENEELRRKNAGLEGKLEAISRAVFRLDDEKRQLHEDMRRDVSGRPRKDMKGERTCFVEEIARDIKSAILDVISVLYMDSVNDSCLAVVCIGAFADCLRAMQLHTGGRLLSYLENNKDVQDAYFCMKEAIEGERKSLGPKFCNIVHEIMNELGLSGTRYEIEVPESSPTPGMTGGLTVTVGSSEGATTDRWLQDNIWREISWSWDTSDRRVMLTFNQNIKRLIWVQCGESAWPNSQTSKHCGLVWNTKDPKKLYRDGPETGYFRAEILFEDGSKAVVRFRQTAEATAIDCRIEQELSHNKSGFAHKNWMPMGTRGQRSGF